MASGRGQDSGVRGPRFDTYFWHSVLKEDSLSSP